MYKKILIILLSFFIFASLTFPALAQERNKLTGSVGEKCLYNDSVVTMDCIMPIFANGVYWLFIMSGVVAVFFIAYGGIKYLTSSGEAKAIESARKTIIWAIVGLITIISSFMIVNIVADLTNVNCITKFGFSACGGSTTGDPDYDDCYGSHDGSCPGGLVCRYSDSESGFACQESQCSNEYPSAECPDGLTCTYDSYGGYHSCQ